MTSSIHKLAAIMFTDIEGYSKLMGEDEEYAIGILTKNFEIQKQLIGEYGGTLLKEMGDGTFVCFHSTTDAVRCAVEIQKQAISNEIKLRIGLHLGEVISVGNDLIGDGVNIAAKLERTAIPGSILISKKVNDELSNKEFETVSLGYIHLKNILRPVSIYAIKLEELAVPKKSQVTHSEPGILSYARTIPAWLLFLLAFITLTSVGWIFAENKPKTNSKDGLSHIAVLPFHFHGDKELKFAGKDLTELVSTRVLESKGVRLIDPDITETYYNKFKKNILGFPESRFAKDFRVEYLIKGIVIQTEDSFLLFSILETSSNEELGRIIYHADNLDSLFNYAGDLVTNLISSIPGADETERSGRFPIPEENLYAMADY